MKRVIVDASVVVAGLLKDGTVRDTLLNSDELTFSAPFYLKEEVDRNLREIIARSKVPGATARAIIEDLLSAIDLVPPGAYSVFLSRARELARAADALPDVEYVALALALEAPIWTLDKDFLRVRKVRTLTTRQVAEIAR